MKNARITFRLSEIDKDFFRKIAKERGFSMTKMFFLLLENIKAKKA